MIKSVQKQMKHEKNGVRKRERKAEKASEKRLKYCISVDGAENSQKRC